MRPSGSRRRRAAARPCARAAAIGGAGVAIVLATGPGGLAHAGVPTLPFPASVESVIEHGEIEGQPVAIQRFRTVLGADAVIARLAREWSGPGRAPMIESSSGPWRIVSWYERERYRTVQLREAAGGGTEGLVSLWGPSGGSPAPRFDPEVLLPPEARVLRRLAADDGGRRSRTLIATAAGSVAWVGAAVEQRLAAHGFAPDPVARIEPDGGARLYRRRGMELALTVAPSAGRTALVLHLIEESR